MILKAGWVVPITAPPIRAGYVQFEAAGIVALGSQHTLPPDAPVEDLGNAVLTPGLVNPHTHLELTAYAGKLPPARFWEWIARLVGLRRQPGRVERERAGVRDGAWQSLRAGVTCVGDVSRENIAWEVLKTIPIRKVCFAELLSLADLPPRNPAELRDAVRAIAEDNLLTAAVSPHAPYSVPQQQIRAALELADQLDRPWCVHWAETPEEAAFLAGDIAALPTFLHGLLEQCGLRPPGLSSAEYLDRCTAGRRPGVLAHVNYADDYLVHRLAAGGHAVVYCPRAHHFFGHPLHPFRRLRVAGVPVAIGTDSAASNESLSLLEELRHVHRRVPGAPPPAELLQMATLDAARALRLETRIGSLEAGKAADLAAFPCPPDAEDPLAALIDTAPVPLGVWVAGQRVV